MTADRSALGDTHREIVRRQIPAGDARAAVIRRHYDAPIEEVWAACTEPDRLNRIFLTVTGDLRAGGTFQFEGNAGGEILRCEPPRLLTVSWAYADRPVDQVELRLEPGADGGTWLTFVHASTENVFSNDPETGNWGVGPAWELSLDALEKYLRGELPDAPATEWFTFDDAVMEQIQQRSDIWAALVAAASSYSD